MQFELQAEARHSFGRTASRQLRRRRLIPAIVYGAEKEPSAIALNYNELHRQMGHEAFYTSILNVKIDGQPQAVVVKSVQRDPVQSDVVHLDFLRIVENEAITLSIPLHFVGADNAKGVKEQGGTVEHLMTEVEVSCLPRDLPDFIEVDITELGLSQLLHLSDLKLSTGVSLVALQHQQDTAVVTINPPRRADDSTTDEAEVTEEAAPEAPEAGNED